MIKDTFFSMPRFASICRKEMVESWRPNLLRFVMMYGIMAIILIWGGYWQYSSELPGSHYSEDIMWNMTVTLFVIAIHIMGMLSASFVMERMKSKTGRINILMTPATMFEKFLARWLIYTFAFLVCFLIAFKLADWTRVVIYNIFYPDIEPIAPVPWDYFLKSGFYQAKSSISINIAAYFCLQSFFVLGSVIWPKRSFVNTCVALVCISIAYITVGVIVAKVFAEKYIEEPNGIFSSEDSFSFVVISLCSFIALFNWTLAYFRFKESEIINRW